MKKTTLLTILFFAAYVGLQAQSSTWNTLGNSFPFFNQNTYFLGTTTEYPLLFRTNNEDRMYISTTGNVGIGTDNPQAKLAVNGAMNALLLEKVEELTRYVIDLQNQIDELKNGKE